MNFLCQQYKARIQEQFRGVDYPSLRDALICSNDPQERRNMAYELTRREQSKTDDFLLNFTPRQRQFIEDNEDCIAIIPEGIYCYAFLGVVTESDMPVMKTRPCGNRYRDDAGEVLCKLLGEQESREDLLLFDSVKACGIGEMKEYAASEPLSPPVKNSATK